MSRRASDEEANKARSPLPFFCVEGGEEGGGGGGGGGEAAAVDVQSTPSEEGEEGGEDDRCHRRLFHRLLGSLLQRLSGGGVLSSLHLRAPLLLLLLARILQLRHQSVRLRTLQSGLPLGIPSSASMRRRIQTTSSAADDA